MTEGEETEADYVLEHAQWLQEQGMIRAAEQTFMRAATLFDHEGRTEKAEYARTGAEYCGNLRIV